MNICRFDIMTEQRRSFNYEFGHLIEATRLSKQARNTGGFYGPPISCAGGSDFHAYFPSIRPGPSLGSSPSIPTHLPQQLGGLGTARVNDLVLFVDQWVSFSCLVGFDPAVYQVPAQPCGQPYDPEWDG